MNLKKETSLKGYLVLMRNAFNLISNKQLTFTQFGAYLYFVSQADWSKQTGHKYSCIIRDDETMAGLLKVSQSTIWRQRTALVKRGMLVEREGLTWVKNMSLFEINTVKAVIKSQLANTHEYFAKTEEELAKKLFNNAETQEDQPQNNRQSSEFPYKSRLDVFNEDDIDI